MTTNPQTRISTREVARILGITRARVQQLAKEKKLLSRVRENANLVTYSLAEVEEFKSRYVKCRAGSKAQEVTREGMMAARCFECFDSQTPFSVIVRKLNLKPTEVRELYKEYKAGFNDPETTEARKERRAIDFEVKRLEIAERKTKIRERQVIAEEQARQLRNLEKGKVG